MEDCKKKKLGAGILTVSIIQLVCYIFGIVGAILNIILLSSNDFPTEILESMKTASNGALSTTSLYISLVFCLILTISLILILFKKALGVYLYFLTIIVNLLYTVIMFGFSLMGLIGLILPILTAIFIYKKRYVFNIGTQCTND